MLTAALAASRCGGGSSASMSTTSPTTNASMAVAIVATNGNKSFVPNPVQTGGQQVVFKNTDITTHHIVMDDGSADFGNLAPGASSAAKAIAGAGSFHCVNHPSMVGSFNAAVAPDPMPGSGDGY
jgi:plastocyanin